MLTDDQKKQLKTLDAMSPKQRSEAYTGSKMYIDLGADLKKYVKEAAAAEGITQAQFIRDCIRERRRLVDHAEKDN
jgi:hypothetical protein